MAFEVHDFKTLMTLESHGPDVFVGVGPVYPWGRVYGGQVVAQALRAAAIRTRSTGPDDRRQIEVRQHISTASLSFGILQESGRSLR